MESKSTIEGLMLELAITIGTNTGCDLLTETMPLFIEKLNCSGAMVIKCNDQDVQEIANTGLSADEQKFLLSEARKISASINNNQPFTLLQTQAGDTHIFLLFDFGLLALRFRETPQPALVQGLLPVVNQLANACRITEQLKKLCSEKDSHCEERSLLHAIIDNIPEPLYVKDNEGRKILLNKAEADLLGVAEVSEVIGTKDSDFFPTDVASKAEAEDRMVIETGKPIIHKEGILTTNSGKEIWIQGTKIPHFNENGIVSGIIGISHNISEYKKIEKELRIIAEKYQSIFNSFVDLYYRSDLNGTILELSPSVFPLSGYKPEELVGKSVTQVYADIERRNRMIELLLVNGSINDYENLLVHKNGKHVPVSITSHLIKDTDGKPGYVEGTIRDISERKEAEEKLNKLLKLQNLLTHLATEFINIPVENSNEAVDRLLSVIGMGNDIDRVYIFEYDFVKNTMSNTHEWCAKGISPKIGNLQQISNELLPTWVITHKKGEMLIVEDVSKLNRNDSLYELLEPQGIKTLITIPLILAGECLGFVGFDSVRAVKVWNPEEITFLHVLSDLLCNVTDRKRKDEALRNREASLKAIFNNVPFQMWLKDVDSNYLAVNKPFMDYFSLNDESEVIGKNALDLWNNDAAVHFMEQDKAVMQNLQLRSVEELIDFKHKSVWFEIFRAPIVDQNGVLLGTTGIARDITSRKNADKVLQEAVDAAESANEAKSKFLAIMSHEIRNPLNAVVGMVRMLHEAGVEGPNSKLVDNIKTSSDHLLMIINDILDFSKIESGEMQLEEANFSIQEVMMRVYNSHIYIAKEKQIDLIYHIDKQLGPAYKGDPLRLQQVLSNLTSNAIKFTPKGKIDIRCRLEKNAGQMASVCFEVEDTGIGICKENQAKIFESFKQENDTISRTHGGSGLGLAISKQIVELMGGNLNLESTKNVGSRFFFSIELPIVEGQSNPHPNQHHEMDSNLLKGCSVLLVEDNKLNQILATTMLEKWETRVVVAGNGQQAIEILENDVFDIILMDIQMPVMDGMTASKMIREKMHIHTPILALTANVVKGIVEKCEEAGMQGYISKPFDTEELYKKIISFIAKAPATETVSISKEMQVADLTRLEKLIGSDQHQLDKMVYKFLELTPSYLAELNLGDTSNNMEAIASASHKIKSSIDLVSTAVMRELILAINQESRKGGNLEEIKPLIKQFNSYYKLLESQLRQTLGALKTA